MQITIDLPDKLYQFCMKMHIIKPPCSPPLVRGDGDSRGVNYMQLHKKTVLTDKIPEEWGNLSQKILANLVLDAFKDGLIDFDEMKDMLNFFSDTDFKEFLKQKNMLHSGGILNLSGACADVEFPPDMDEL
jgi:hypothetical protein